MEMPSRMGLYTYLELFNTKNSHHRGTESTEKCKLGQIHYAEISWITISSQLAVLIGFLCALCVSVVNNSG